MRLDKQKILANLILIVFINFSFYTITMSQEKNVFKERRAKLAAKIESGIAIIQSTEKNQDNLHEFFIPNSDNHDFIYLTGLETPNATLILSPGSKYSEILYIDGDQEEIQQRAPEDRYRLPYRALKSDGVLRTCPTI